MIGVFFLNFMFIAFVNQKLIGQKNKLEKEVVTTEIALQKSAFNIIFCFGINLEELIKLRQLV